MDSKVLKSVMVATLALGLVIGCGFDGDDPDVHQPPPQQQPPKTNPSNPNPTSQKTQKPTVDATSNSSCQISVPLRGTTGVNTSVLITGGRGDIAADPSGVSGNYCAMVKLKPNQLNTLQVFAHDPKYGLSDPITIKISHAKCKDDVPTVPTDQPKSKNVALGMKGKASQTAESGNENFLTDGKTSTTATYTGGWGWGISGGTDVWISLKLEKLVEASKIVVKWRDSKGDSTAYYGYKYRVLVATGTPTDPNIKDGYWTEIATVTDGNGGIDLFDLKNTKPLVQHVALYLEKDGANSWSHHFAVAEVEVWDTPKKSTPTIKPQKNSCASGGGNSYRFLLIPGSSPSPPLLLRTPIYITSYSTSPNFGHTRQARIRGNCAQGVEIMV